MTCLLLLALPLAAGPLADPADEGGPPAAPVEDRLPEAEPEPVPLPPLAPCPPEARCVDDAVLLAALLVLEGTLLADTAEEQARTAATLQTLGALGDPRAVPRLLALSRVRARPQVRLSALTALGNFLAVPAARARLERALHPDEPVEDASAALPFLLLAAQREGRPAALPCPEGARCADDGLVLGALLLLDEAEETTRAEGLLRLGALSDPRGVPTLWRYSFSQRPPLKAAALGGLAAKADDPRARARLLAVLKDDVPEEVELILPGLVRLSDGEVTEALLEARRRTAHAELRPLLEDVLRPRAPTELNALLEEEARRLAAGEGDLPLLDYANRGVIALDAAIAGAYGGAAASALVADQVLPGQAACYGCYGCGVGCASAGALSWFALGDRKLGAADVGLAVSASLWGAWAGAFVPATIAGDQLDDVRHVAYSAALGQLTGLGAGTAAAFFLKPDASDLLEMNLAVLAANGLAFGGLTSLATGGDIRFLWGSLVGATLVGAVGGGAASRYVDLAPHEVAHVAATSFTGAGLGLQLGLAAFSFDSKSERVLGLPLVGASVGLLTAGVLAAPDLSPSLGGSLYQLWATAIGSGVGLGAGLLVDNYAPLPGGVPPGVTPFALGASLGLMGALSTVALPGGVSQDAADLLAQPLLVGFSLYHVTALLAAADADWRLTLASALLVPSAVSAGLTFTAPLVDGTLGDVSMVAAMMSWGAWVSSMGTWSVASRVSTPAWGWIAATSAGIDLGLLAGVGLNFLDVDKLGWRVTYVTAVAGASTLLLALPGTLGAIATNGLVQVPDVLLLSSLLGLGVGLVTMPFIDFRVAPDLGLDRHLPVELPTGVELSPAIVPLPPAPQARSNDMPVTFGLLGRY